MEKVSIVIPVYNTEKYIANTLSSVLSQSYKNIEVICVDDGSTDESVNIIKQFDSNLVQLYRLEHKNAGAARNFGFSKVTGTYVIFIDADDIYDDTFIEKAVNKIEDYNSDFVLCGTIGVNDITKEFYSINDFDDANNKLYDVLVFSKDDYISDLFQLSITWAWDKLYRTDFIRQNKLSFQENITVNDMSFVCMSYIYATRVAILKEQLICHRSNVQGSLYYEGTKNWICLFKALDELKTKLLESAKFQEYEKTYLNLFLYNIVYYLIYRFDNYSDFMDFYSYLIQRDDFILDFSDKKDLFDNTEAYNIVKELLGINSLEDFLVKRIKSLYLDVEYLKGFCEHNKRDSLEVLPCWKII